MTSWYKVEMTVIYVVKMEENKLSVEEQQEKAAFLVGNQVDDFSSLFVSSIEPERVFRTIDEADMVINM